DEGTPMRNIITQLVGLLRDLADLWPLWLPLLAGAAAIFILLPRPKAPPMLWGILAGVAALVLGGGLLVQAGGVDAETVLFYAFSGLAIVSGAMLVTQSHPARAALSFAMVVLSTCGLFLLQAAPFLMAATTIVYAGAIVVTFLFVIMLAQQTGWSDADWRSREPFIATLAGFVLVGALLYLLQKTYETPVLHKILERAEAASQSDPPSHELGNDEEFLTALQAELEKIRGGQDREALLKEVTIVRGSWKEWKDKRDFQEMRAALHRIAENGSKLRDQIG